MKYTDIVNYKYVVIQNITDEIHDIFLSLVEDGYEVDVNEREVKTILSKFYDYYEKKNILYLFSDTMIGHFEDMAIIAEENDMDIDLNFVLKELQVLELLDSSLAVIPRDTRMILKILSKTLERGSNHYERKCY